MPIYVGYTQKRRTVKLLSAGKNQIFLCDAGDIVLRAELNDETNIRNYTFEWNQLTGPDAQLVYVDELTSIFHFADTVDKKFRFTVDKGTPQEQSAEVDIFYTPTSIRQPVVSNKTSNSSFSFAIPNKVETEVILFDSTDKTFQWNFLGQFATELSFDSPKSFYGEGNITRFELYGSDEFSRNPSDLIMSVPGSDYPEMLVLPKGSYRFKIYYTVKGLKKSVLTDLYISNPKGEDNYYAVNTQHKSGTQRSNLNYIRRFAVTRELVNDSYAIDFIINHRRNNLVRFTQLILNPEIEPLLEDSHSIVSVFNTKLNTVTRVDPSNIGNE